DSPQCSLELCSTVTALTKETIAREALRMDARQNGLVAADIAQHNSKVLFTTGRIDKGMPQEFCPGRGQAAGRHVVEPIACRCFGRGTAGCASRFARNGAGLGRHESPLIKIDA